MPDPSGSNPFAASQVDPGQGEDVSLDDSHLLIAAEVECSRMRFWMWMVGIMFAGLSLYGLVIFFMIILDGRTLMGVILNLLMLSLYAVAAVLILRCVSKVSEFRSLTRPFQLEEVLVSHAACWKFFGIVSVFLLTLFILLVLKDILLLV